MEKLRKVNSFSELKIGQIVVVVNCRQCNKAKCRKMLTKIEINAKVDPSNPHYENAWYGLPKCNLKPLYLLAVAETTVA
jgi:hypothetical protein